MAKKKKNGGGRKKKKTSSRGVRKLKPGSLKGGKNQPFKGKRGSGERWDECVKKMKKKGARNPEGLCGAIKRAK